MITVITFNSQYTCEDANLRVDDVTQSGAGVHWTSLDQETGALEMEIWFTDWATFLNQFSGTNSYQYYNI